MQHDNRDTMARFCEREHGRLVGILTLHLGDRRVAEELANEALITLCERWSTIDELRNPQAWVTRVALNQANSWLRRRVAERRARARLADQPAPAAPADTDDALAIRTAVAALPQRQRAALVLRYWDGMSAAEAGEVLGIEPATVRALTHQAVTALRTEFTFDLDEELTDVR